MKIQVKQHEYKTSLKWTEGRKGILSCGNKEDIEVACGPEFGGHAGFWSPEDMFVGAIDVCTMATFMWLADRRKLKVASYESECEGRAQLSGGSMRYTSLVVKVKIEVREEGDRKKAEKILQELGRWCLITNSIEPEVEIKPEITVGGSDK